MNINLSLQSEIF